MGPAGEDPTSEPTVEALLEAGRPRGSIQERQALAEVENELFGRAPALVTLSRYVLLDRLGAGGAGVVYRGYDPDLDRRVAIKLLQAHVGAESEWQRRVRLLREAQAMAKLAHPNVIAVHDVGSYDERDLGLDRATPDQLEIPLRGVFIVMELVEGVDLGHWLKTSQRPWRDTVRVMVAAGRGLAAAHAQGLVHRDFKPANVLVGEDGRVRVLDFGLAWGPGRESAGSEARPASDDPTSTSDSAPVQSAKWSRVTATGTVMGTPRYMSPEQHRGSAGDPRSDQYSFCVALFEALYRQPPFEGATPTELAEQKTRGELPPAPRSSGVPRRLRRILVRGLSPRADARYVDMDTLLTDLGRDPARLARWLAVGGVIVAVAAGIAWDPGSESVCAGFEDRMAGVWDEAHQASVRRAMLATAQPYSKDVWSTVKTELDTYAARWLRMRSALCEATVNPTGTSPDVLERRGLCLERRLQGLSELTALLATADAAVVERAADAVSQLGPLIACESPERVEDLPSTPVAKEAASQISRQLQRAAAFHAAGRYAAALTLGRKALADAEELGHVPTLVDATLHVTKSLQALSEFDEAEAVAYEGLAASERAGRADLATRVMVELVPLIGLSQGRYAEAVRVARQIEARFEYHAPSAQLHALFATNYATVRLEQGRFEDALTWVDSAIAMQRDLHGETSPRIAASLNTRGNILARLGRSDEAWQAHQESLAMRREIYGANHPETARALNNISGLAFAEGRAEESLAYNRQALEIQLRALGEDDKQVAISYGNLGAALMVLGRHDEALDALRSAVRIGTRVLDPNHLDLAQAHSNLGGCLIMMGRPNDALEPLGRAHGIWTRALANEHPEASRPLQGLAMAHLALGDPAKAAGYLQRAVEIEREWGKDPVRRAELAVDLAVALTHAAQQ